MSTEQAFVIHNAHYNEEKDSSEDVVVTVDGEYLSLDKDLNTASITDILELADWLSGGIAAMSQALDALVERAERVQEGEEWDLAEFILRKKKEVDNTFGKITD